MRSILARNNFLRSTRGESVLVRGCSAASTLVSTSSTPLPSPSTARFLGASSDGQQRCSYTTTTPCLYQRRATSTSAATKKGTRTGRGQQRNKVAKTTRATNGPTKIRATHNSTHTQSANKTKEQTHSTGLCNSKVNTSSTAAGASSSATPSGRNPNSDPNAIANATAPFLGGMPKDYTAWAEWAARHPALYALYYRYRQTNKYLVGGLLDNGDSGGGGTTSDSTRDTARKKNSVAKRSGTASQKKGGTRAHAATPLNSKASLTSTTAAPTTTEGQSSATTTERLQELCLWYGFQEWLTRCESGGSTNSSSRSCISSHSPPVFPANINTKSKNGNGDDHIQMHTKRTTTTVTTNTAQLESKLLSELKQLPWGHLPSAAPFSLSASRPSVPASASASAVSARASSDSPCAHHHGAASSTSSSTFPRRRIGSGALDTGKNATAAASAVARGTDTLRSGDVAVGYSGPPPMSPLEYVAFLTKHRQLNGFLPKNSCAFHHQQQQCLRSGSHVLSSAQKVCKLREFSRKLVQLEEEAQLRRDEQKMEEEREAQDNAEGAEDPSLDKHSNETGTRGNEDEQCVSTQSASDPVSPPLSGAANNLDDVDHVDIIQALETLKFLQRTQQAEIKMKEKKQSAMMEFADPEQNDPAGEVAEMWSPADDGGAATSGTAAEKERQKRQQQTIESGQQCVQDGGLLVSSAEDILDPHQEKRGHRMMRPKPTMTLRREDLEY